MIDRSKLDIEESVVYNIEKNDLTYSSCLSEKIPLNDDELYEIKLIESLKDLKLFSHEPDLVLLDGVISLDGSFFQYCREYGIKSEKIAIHSIIVSGGSDTEVDPFGINGAFYFTNGKKGKENVEFVKYSLDITEPKSYVILNKNTYKNYVELKANYIKWLTNRDGVEVKVVGGENYVQQKTDRWLTLFVDTIDGAKDSLKAEIDNFAKDKDREAYNNVSLPWKKVILIAGPHGCGKTSIINTIISEYDFDPYTISPDQMSDYALNYTFSTLENFSDTFLFIEDIDKMLEDGRITPTNLIKALDTCKPVGGLLVVLTCEKTTNDIKNMLYRFDYVADLSKVSYEEAIEKLFLPATTPEERKAICGLVKANNLNYQHITCLYEQFMKSIIKNDGTSYKKQNKLSTIKALITSIVQEDSAFGPSKSKKGNKIGLK